MGGQNSINMDKKSLDSNKTTRFLGVIPARGGSKRIPDKNIRMICGHPLVWWSIMAGLQSKLLDKVVVSSDDTRVLDIATSCGAETIMRPEDLSGDNLGLTPVLGHALELYPSMDCVVLLRPTSPIRVQNVIDKCVREFLRRGMDSLSTGYVCKNYEWGTMPDMPSQLMEGWFYNDGCVEVHRREVILAGESFGERRYGLEVPQYFNYELDTELDWVIVSCLMEYLGLVYDHEG